MIKNFTILGERCSGTNYLEELIKTNFNIDITWKYGWKHFFGFYNFQKNQEEDETLFIGIVRHPIYWIDSFFREQHHIPNKPKNLDSFLFNEFYSIDEKNNNEIIKNDFNYITGKKYKNIFELRFLKNSYLINTMPNNVKNYILINYENLRDNTNNVLSIIEQRFSLIKKFEIYKNIDYYKNYKNKKYNNKKIQIPIKYQIICSLNLNKIQEAKLGYNINVQI
jgi:hypothetical protein